MTSGSSAPRSGSAAHVRREPRHDHRVDVPLPQHRLQLRVLKRVVRVFVFDVQVVRLVSEVRHELPCISVPPAAQQHFDVSWEIVVEVSRA